MKVKRLSRREKEKLMHRRQMLDTSLKLFSEKGYHNVTMYEIAEEAEFAIGTLYKFFKNKEDFYKALMMEKAEEYHRILGDVLSREDDVPTVLRDYVAAKAEMFADDLATVRLYFAETRGASFNIKAGLDQDILKLYNKLIEQLTSVMERGVRKKVLRKLDPYYMATALEGIANAFLLTWLENPEEHPYKSNVPVIMDLFLKGTLVK